MSYSNGFSLLKSFWQRGCVQVLVLLLISTMQANAQSTSLPLIKGTVKDAKGPLAGVTITQKNTGNAVISNENGAFSIQLIEGQKVIQLSMTGFSMQELDVSSNNDLNVQLETSVASLGEVVVVGYGTQKRSDLTGSVATVKASKLADRVTSNPLDALSGQVPGLNIYNNAGRPGGNLTVNLRGFNSISASNSPLFVIDGIVGADLQMLNPSDIETVDVLKDASSTAIYGSRGANGVIIVTTKKARSGDFTLKYDGSLSLNTVARKIDMLDANGYVDWFTRAWTYDPKRGPVPDLATDYPDLFTTGNKPKYNTNWQDASTRNSVSNRHFISLTQGTAKSKSGLFLGYQDDEGIMKETYFKKFSARYNTEMNIRNWLSVGGSLGYNQTKANIVDDYRVGAENVTRMMLEMLPIFPIQYPNGKYSTLNDFGYGINADGSHYKSGIYAAENPVRLLKEIPWIFNTDQLLANTFINVKLAKGLEFRTTYAAQILNRKNNLYVGKDLLDLGTPSKGVASVGSSRNIYWQNENYLTYNTLINNDHAINAVAGASWMQTSEESVGASATSFSTDYFQYNNLAAGSVRGTPYSGYYNFKLNSYYGRLNYAFQNKYLLTLTGRYDGSSKFGANNKYAFFPSGAVGWVASREKFLENSKLISFLKIRGSYGITGNSEISPYSSLGTIGNYGITLNNQLVNGSGPGSVPNSNLRWEQTAQLDIGFDLSILKNRISLTADYYHKKTTNLLLNVPISQVSGYGSVTTNIGSVQNKGIELALNALIIDKKDFSWNASVILASNKNEILALGTTNSDIFPGPGFLGQTNVLQVGKPVGNFWGFQRLGTWSDKEADQAALYGKKPGDIKRLDVNGDKKFDNSDAMVLGNMFPKYEMTFSTSVQYKNWTLSADIQVRQGNKVMNITTLTIEDRQHYANSYGTILAEAWTPQNQNTQVPSLRLANADPFGTDLTFFMDSRWVEDGSFVRGKSLNLAYQFPTKISKRVGLSAFRVYGNVQNFFLSTKFRGYDPEVSTFSGSFAQGIEFYSTPRPRTFTFGINATF
jgi:TonB-dependent starch-binding outer membrane protein SusC